MTGDTHVGKLIRVALLFALTLGLQAAPELSSELNSNRFFAGDGIVWTLVVSGARQVDEPDFGSSPDFFSRALEPQILEKDSKRTFIYRYQLVPRRAGLLPLPSIAITADGEDLSPEERVLNVADPQSTDALRLELSLDQNDVYVGQAVGVTFKLLTTLRLTSLNAMDLRLPLLYSPDCDVITPVSERRAGGQEGTIGLPVEGQRIIGTLSELKINEDSFTVITFRRILVPRQSGELEFSAARLLCSYLTNSQGGKGNTPRYPSYFNNDFFQDIDGNTPYVRYSAQSKPLTLSVRPLPDANRPANYSGIVGHGKMQIEADPQTLVIGDPVTLTLKLRDFEMPEALRLPPLADLADFTSQFQLPETQASPRHTAEESTYVNSIRPLRTAITQIPALKLVIFNPDSAAYETLASEPIPLRVRPDGNITSINLGPDSPSSLTVNPQGIWNNLPANAVDPLTKVGRLLKMTAPVWLIVPPVLFLALAGVARKHRLKRTNPERWRQVTAFSKLRKSLGGARDARAQRAAVATYLATRLGIREAALSEREVLRSLASRDIRVSDETTACLHEIFLRADLEHFGRDPGKPTSKLDAARLLTALKSLEGNLES